MLSQSALCHAAEAVVMAISSALDSAFDNGCNTLSVLFTSGLTCLLSFPQPSPQITEATFHSHKPPPPHIHTLLNRRRQSGWQRGVAPLMKHLEQTWKPVCVLCAPPPLLYKDHINKWAWPGGRGRKYNLIMLRRPHPSAKWKACFLGGWGGGWGLKQHQAPAAPHDCAVIAG